MFPNYQNFLFYKHFRKGRTIVNKGKIARF